MKKIFIGIFFLLLVKTATLAQDTAIVQPVDTTVTPVDTTVSPSTKPTLTHELPNGEVYTIKKKGIHIPILVVGSTWSGYAFTKIYSKDPSTDEQIENLDRNDIIPFNRSAIDRYNLNSEKIGDYIFYGSMPAPLLLMLDKKIRRDAGKVAFMYFETMSVTGLLYTGSVYFKDKYRPYAYNPEVPMSERKRGGAKNSFFAGHPALVASSTFFIAKVYSDYHPNSGFKWVLWTIAAGATATTAWARYDAGQHFPTDIIIGVTQGTLAGILIPHFHKNKKPKYKGLTVLPMMGESYGFSATYRF
jgi:membrane-associated phospholipid phosphatase